MRASKQQRVPCALMGLALWCIVGSLLMGTLEAQCTSVSQVPNQTISSGTSCFESADTLTAAGVTINGSANVTFRAGNTVHLTPGFRATAGSAGTTFHASVGSVPSAVSVSPSTGSGTSQVFTWVVSSPSGYSNLAQAYALLNTSSAVANACYIYYNRASNALSLGDNAGTGWLGGFTPGGTGSASNSACTIYGSGSSVTPSGNQLSITVNVAFQSAFAGAKINYLRAIDNASHTSGWQQVGTWTVTGTSTTPTITGLSPSSGTTGSSVVISGSNFSSSGTVTFNGTTASTSNWTSSSITATVPSGATTGNVVVSAGGVASNGWQFTVTSSPAIGGLAPTAGPTGTAVTISGTNFGAAQGTSTVMFNGVAATVTNWSATSITANVPASATTGNVVVTVGGVASNGVAFSVTAAPTISGISSSSGPVGASITISGSNFGSSQGSSTVKFNGTVATASSWSSTSIAATVPSGATTGNIVVTVGGVSSNAIAFSVTSGPGITSLSPNSGPVGTSVVIAGTYFGATQGSSTVTFNGTAASVSNWSATSVSATVPAGASSGSVVITVGGVASNGVSFTVSSAPNISLLSPNAGQSGTQVVISGSGFGTGQGTSTVKFNGVAASVSSWSDTSITTVVPAGATSGNVVVTVNSVNSNGAAFTVTVGPTITGISPSGALAGATVAISGSGFGTTSCASCITFNGTAASVVTAWSATSISVVVPSAATSGNVVVSIGGVPSNAVNFSVGLPPTVSGIAPTSGAVGTVVTVTGANFGASQGSNSSVRFNGVGATDVSTWSSTSIVARVPSGATSGPISVVVNGTSGNSAESFTVNTTVKPNITSILPATALSGATVTITGENFGSPQGSSTVTFGSVEATAYSWTTSAIIAVVPWGAASGDVVVHVNSMDSNPFKFTAAARLSREYVRMNGRVVAIENAAPPPVISSLSTVSGAVGTTITINGTDFGASGTVTFNGTSSTTTNWNSTTIQAPVPSGASTGRVVVTTNGISSNGIYFTVSGASNRPSLSVTKSHSGNLVRGQQGTYTINIYNAPNAGSTSGTVSVNDGLPSGLTLSNMYGSGWSCSGSICSRSDALAPGASYAPITVVVIVASSAASSVTNQATVSGGNNASSVTVSDSTTIVTAPALYITKSHSGNFVQGQSGSFTVSVGNQAGTSNTSGLVTVSEVLPPGLTMLSMSGVGWSCVGSSCSRSDSLAPGYSFSPITVGVNVASTASTPLVNSVSVTGGGSVSSSTTDSVNVSSGNVGPQWVSVSPNTGTGTIGAAQTFDVIFSDSNGAADITDMQFMLNSSPSNAGGCWVWYSNGTFTVADSLGNWSTGNLSNELCTLNLASSSATVVDSTSKKLRVNLSFNENRFGGLKYIYTWAQDRTGTPTGSLYGAWRGSWTIPANILVSLSPIGSVYVPVNQSQGHLQTFTATVTGTTNTNVTWSLPDGGGDLVANGNSATFGALASSSGSFVRVRATSQADPSKYAETWVSILPYAPNGLSLLAFSPVNGSGNRATFTLGVRDSNGVSDVTWLQPFFSVTFPLNSGAGGCHVIFYPAFGNPSAGVVYLDGAGGGNTWAGGSSAVGAGGTTLQNGVCAVRTASSSISLNQNEYYLNLDIEFQGTLIGASKREYLSAGSGGNPWPGTDWLYWGWWY